MLVNKVLFSNLLGNLFYSLLFNLDLINRLLSYYIVKLIIGSLKVLLGFYIL